MELDFSIQYLVLFLNIRYVENIIVITYFLNGSDSLEIGVAVLSERDLQKKYYSSRNYSESL